MEQFNLKQLQKLLEGEELDCQLVEKEDAIETFLSIFLGSDQQHRGYWINLKLIPQFLMDEETEVEEGEMNPTYYALSFTMDFPFKVKTSSVSNVARLVAFLNSSAHLPGFEFSEVDLQVSYRYVLMGHKSAFHKKILVGVVGNAFVIKEMYSEMLEKVCVGKMSMNEVLEDVVERIKEVMATT